MKYLYETILDIDRLSTDADANIKRRYELPDELNKEYGHSWEVARDALTLVDATDFRIDEKFLKIIAKHNIHKLIFPRFVRIQISGVLNLTEIEIVSRTRLNIHCSELKLSRCKLSSRYSISINCTKLSLASCEVEAPILSLDKLSRDSFNFGNSRMNVGQLYINTADEKWLDHLKNLGVKNTRPITWSVTPGEYSHIDPLDELGLNPKQWEALDMFSIGVTRNNLWGISTRNHPQFCWTRRGAPFASQSPALPNGYFLNWDRYGIA